MLNRDVFHTDPEKYQLPNEGVAKISFPPSREALQTLRGELETFVCDGKYAEGLSRILEAFLASAGKGGGAPAVWISGFYGSGKSHLAIMLAALWTNLEFDDGATAEGLVSHIPTEVAAPLKELRAAAKRMGGVLAAGDTLGTGPSDPAEATLGIILRAVGLPTQLRAAQVALWLDDLGILDSVRATLGATFNRDIRNFILAPRFAEAVLSAKPDLANNVSELGSKLQDQFPEPPPVTVDHLEDIAGRALKLGRDEFPLTLIVLDEVQQFIRQDPGLTLQIQTIAERLSSRFDGRVLLVATGQQALSDVQNLQKLLDRFSVQIALGEADIDSVIRKTVLRKKAGTESAIKDMLDKCSGEISRHLAGTRLAHTMDDNADAVLDWPLLPTRRRLWEHILREIDRPGMGGTLRGQLRTTLDAARRYADRPLGNAVTADFLYDRFSTEAFNAGLLPGETRNRIEALKSGSGDDQLKARILMLVYMLGRIAGDADHHGVRAKPETIADVLVEDLSGEPELRKKVPELLAQLQDDGAAIEVSGDWRLQTKESAEWENAFRTEERAVQSDAQAVSRSRRELITQAIEQALAPASSVTQGISRQQRKIHRLQPDDAAPSEGVPLRIHTGWDEDLQSLEKEIAKALSTDPTVHLLVPHNRRDELSRALTTKRAAEGVLQLKGVPQTDAGREAQAAMQSRADNAERMAREIIQEAVEKGRVLQAGGNVVPGSPADAVKQAAENALARLYPEFSKADHAGWAKVFERARKKDPDALKAVDHSAEPDKHPVCKGVLEYLGPGKKGAEIRSHFMGNEFGWSQDAVDGALTVLDNAGLLRVVGEDGKSIAVSEVPRAKIGPSTFRTEKTIVKVNERLAVRGLLTDAGVTFEKDHEVVALAALLDRLEVAASEAGGEPPAPAPDQVPDIKKLRGMSGNDLLVALAEVASDLRARLKEWQAASQKIQSRLDQWRLAERLVRLGAAEQEEALEAVRKDRTLLAEPDPVPPIVRDATESLRSGLNEAYQRWETKWQAGEERLSSDESWSRISPEQRRQIREEVGLLKVEKPAVDTAGAIAAALEARGLSEWESMARAIPTRVDDALAAAAVLVAPKARTVSLPGGLIETQDDLDAWLDELRKRIEDALADGPVIPKV